MLIIVFGVTTLIFAWQNPSVAPPGGNLSGFLNTSSTAQTKTGALTINGILTASSTLIVNATTTSNTLTVTNGANLAISGGNVGIGSTSPAAKLAINGTTEQMRLSYDASNYQAFTVDSTGAMTIAQDGGAATLALTNGSVGIGTTGPTLGGSVTQTNVLQVLGQVKSGGGGQGGNQDGNFSAGFGSFSGANWSGNALFGYNLYSHSTGNADKYRTPFAISGYAGVEGFAGGILKFYTATGAQTAGADITPSEKMRIDSSGNVGIGTTSPGANMKLQVAGDIVGTAQVFKAYMTASFAKAAGTWEKIPFNATVFNTLQGTFNTTLNRFTASRAGYYQISETGFSSTDGADSERYAIGVFKNGGNEGFVGGNYGIGDTPLAGFSMIVYLNGSTDYVEIWMFSAVAVNLVGGSGGGHVMLWNMNYLGT